jgi:hypothetical protein
VLLLLLETVVLWFKSLVILKMFHIEGLHEMPDIRWKAEWNDSATFTKFKALESQESGMGFDEQET